MPETGATQFTFPDAHAAVTYQRLREIADAYVSGFDSAGQANGRQTLEVHAPLPSYEDFADCMRIVFLASLQEEEGRHISLSVGFAPRDSAGADSQLQAAELRDAIELTPENLVKVASAVDSSHTQVAVLKSEGRLRIWGLVRGTSQVPNSENRVSGSLLQEPNHLVFRAPRPGRLSIQYLGSSAFVYSIGQTRTPDAAGKLVQVLVEHWPIQLGANHAVLTDTVRDIVAAVLERGRGGTLLFAREPRSIAAQFESWYAFAEPVSALRQLKELGERRRGISFIAHLTQADGVVVLDPLLQPHGFRAMIGSLGPAVSGGARHRSANSVVAQSEPGSVLAVVCSHEGQVTILWRAASGVEEWRADGTSIVLPEW
ncbi:MAG: hypothetical protein QM723_10185 [Myxococcaceae bacterium]